MAASTVFSLKVMPETFSNAFGNQLTIHDVVAEIRAFMAAAPARHYKVTIGTDSELLASKKADFVTAIVVHRIGNGGRYFWQRFTLGTFHTLRDRIIREVLTSIDVAKAMIAELAAIEDELPEFEFEIHADVGENGPTKQMIQEVVGMIRANNFAVQTKPNSYAATNVADRHV